MAQRMGRLKKELQQLTYSPPPGVSCWPENDDLTLFGAVITGEESTVYAGGLFKLEIEVPDKYPFLPPKVRFVTKVYHPNIDPAGRICMDTLKVPPSGSWRPIYNIASLLTAIRLLLSSPNPDDPLMPDIAEEFKYKYAEFELTAREWTDKYAQAGVVKLPATATPEALGKKRSLQPGEKEGGGGEHSRSEEENNNKKQKL